MMLPQHSSESVEWYTPEDYIKLVREVFFGDIDLDPASCERANKIIKARAIYTKEDDGLKQDWHGKVFCNPPYGRGVTNKWITKMIDSHKNNGVEGIILVNANTSTKWFKKLFDYPICFVNHRIAFINQYGEQQTSPPNANVFAYFGHGHRNYVFEEVFSKIGSIYMPRGLWK